MVIGILQFDLLIHGAESLKDKRRVVLSVKDKLHRDHQVSVAEVALQDKLDVARLGLAMVGADGKYVGQSLDRITSWLRALTDCELGDVSREVLHDPQGRADAPGAQPAPDDDLIQRMLDDARKAPTPGHWGETA